MPKWSNDCRKYKSIPCSMWIFLLLSSYNRSNDMSEQSFSENKNVDRKFLRLQVFDYAFIIVLHLIDELSWSTNLCCPNKYIKFNDLSIYSLVTYITCLKVWKIKGYKNPSIAFKDFHLNECREKTITRSMMAN